MSLNRKSILAAVCVFAACSMAGCTDQSAPLGTEQSEAAAPMTDTTSTDTTSTDALQQARLAKAEGMIDAFYSFDSARLEPFLAKAGEARGKILYYQGWAEGGNYKVLNRAPCVVESDNVVRCSITVEDDPVMALGMDFKVTDSFAITFDGEEIVGVKTSSDDKPVYHAARKWVEANLPQVMAGPCKDRGSDAGTPGDCARAMTDGYRQFAASEDFPGIDWEG